MGEVRIEDWVLNIELEKTKELYASHTELCDCLFCENFRQASFLLQDEVVHFCDALGLNLHKPSLLNAFPVEGEQVMYSGHYSVYGEIIEGELDAWDVVVGEHCFSLVQEEGKNASAVIEPHFQIGFEVVFNWLLPKSMELIEK
ncbi:hypothetical protein LYSIN_03298 [Lysinibacillus sphaericus]|uniref:Uncharacterized protein n=1 Tax=Lysinibacillus sphaericus TaxID=1421 RepID=A0A2S5CVY5_LYSSH|nr:hypothetical protein [Lysinibacillus sphaericus]POZ55003.1 hypothetical protein LYSIN_03298 [Lysinibacillus sphaericus]